MRRVAVTGIGLVTPLGIGTHASWSALKEGTSGIGWCKDERLVGYPVTAAGQVRGLQEHLDLFLSKKEQQKTDRFSHLALLAAREALSSAGFPDMTEHEKERTGVYVGVGIGGIASIVDAAHTLQEKGLRRVSPYLIPKVISNEAASLISISWGLKGPVMCVTTACSSGADAIGQAARAIQAGAVDAMVAGGAESTLTPLAFAGFGNMRALARDGDDPTTMSRPFDATRSGFVMSEGAGMLLLEEWGRAQRRGAKIYAEVVGYGATCDAYHTTALHPEGLGGQEALRQALYQAQVAPQEIAYINAHGTSTPMNDVTETNIVKRVFSQHAYNGLLMSSTKSMTGHMLGAAGGVEAGITALALMEQCAPPTINLQTPDPACDLNYVAHTARTFSGEYAMSNSFGFGGSNVSLILKKA